MSKHRQSSTWLLMVLAMVLLWVAAHDGYVTRINQQQQLLIQKLQQGHHDLSWPLNDSSELVAGFGSGWRWQSKGLQLDPQTAEISLAFNERFIVPGLYQQLTFDWLSQQATVQETQLFLEFSQVDSGVFYYSPSIKVKSGLNQINLSQLIWTAKNDRQSRQLNWQDLPQLNTLVWRFSQQEGKPNNAFLRHLSIPQAVPLETVEQAPPLTALLSNQLRQQWQSQRFSLNSPPVMKAYLTISPWILFVLAVLFLMVAVKIDQPPVGNHQGAVHKNGALVVIVLVAVIAVMMQTRPFFKVLDQFPWLATMIFVLPTMLLVKRWLQPKKIATPIWLITLVVAVLMFYGSDSGWTFIRDLPLYLLWALAQQVILGPLVSDYMHHKAGLSKTSVALLCGVLFALLHVPNQMLMLATFLGGLFWSYAWLRYQNIYANAVSHALLALLFYQSMPEHLLGSARVGLWF